MHTLTCGKDETQDSLQIYTQVFSHGVGKYCGSPNYTLDHRVSREQGPQDTLQTSSASTPLRIFFTCSQFLWLLVWPDPLPHTNHQQGFVIYPYYCKDKIWSLKLCVGNKCLLLKQKTCSGNKYKEQFTPLHWNEGYISRYLRGKKKKRAAGPEIF